MIARCEFADPVTLSDVLACGSGERLEDVSGEGTADCDDAPGAGDWDV